MKGKNRVGRVVFSNIYNKNGVIKVFHVKVFAVLLSAISPFILMICYGMLGSISQYWDTSLQPLFILSNIITAYFFFSLKNWRIPSLFLVLLTAFSWEQFSLVHDIFAILFFGTCLWSLWNSGRFLIFFYLMWLSVFIMSFSLLWGEIVGILILSSFHLKVILYQNSLLKRNP